MGADSLVIREWGRINKGPENRQISIDEIVLNKDAWDFFSVLASYRYLRFLNKTQLQFKGFVGVITAPDGTQLEIIPKIEESITSVTVGESRLTLENMLKVVNNLKVVESTEAFLKNKKAPLIEVLIGWFLKEVSQVTKKGIRQDYSRVEAHEQFLKGQLQLSKQLREPLHKQHNFHIEYDVFSADRPENRLIHSALFIVSKWSKDNANQRLAKHFLLLFDGIPLSEDYKIDFSNWSSLRDMHFYQMLLPWLKLILNQQSPFSIADKNAGISFLLPMEELFEKYVAKSLSAELPIGYRLTEQKPQKPLVESFLVGNKEGKGAFQLKPDIVIHDSDKPIYILDTKWKRIDQGKKYDNGADDKKRGISQGDMYQLFAYGKKYNLKTVVLVYPKWSRFNEPMKFEFDKELSLLVTPFTLTHAGLSDCAPIIGELDLGELVVERLAHS